MADNLKIYPPTSVFLFNAGVFVTSFASFLILRWIRKDHLRPSGHVGPVPPGRLYSLVDEQLENLEPMCANAEPSSPSSATFLGELWNLDINSFHSYEVQCYLRFLKMCANMCWTMAAVGLPLIIHSLVAASDASKEIFNPLAATVWMSYVYTWLFSAFALFYILKMWRDLRKSRLNVSHELTPEQFALIVRNVDMWDLDGSVITNYFKKLQPGHVVCVNLILDFRQLLSAKEKMETIKRQLGEAMGDENHRGLALLEENIHSDEPARQRLQVPQRPKRLASVEEINLLEETYAQQTQVVRHAALLKPVQNSGVAFAIFNSATATLKSLRDANLDWHLEWKVERAPPPGDLTWSNIHLNSFERCCRLTVAYLVVFIVSVILTSSALVSEWIIPVAKGVDSAIKKSDLTRFGIAANTAPLFILVINSLVLPGLVTWSANFSKFWRKSITTAAILHGNATFLLLSSLIYPIVGIRSIWGFLASIMNSKFRQWNVSMYQFILQNAGNFAVRYLLNACFLSSAVQLLQLPQFFYTRVVSYFMQQQNTWNFDFGFHYAFCTSIFSLCMVACVFFPVVLPFAALFYTIKFFTDKYNFAFNVWSVTIDSGGAVTRTALHYLVFAITLLQFAMSGYFLKVGLTESSRANRILTFAGTVLFISSTLLALLQLGKISNIASLVADWNPDSLQIDRSLTDWERTIVTTAYQHPCERGKNARLWAL